MYKRSPTHMAILAAAALATTACDDITSALAGEERVDVIYEANCEMECSITYHDEEDDEQAKIDGHIGPWSLKQKHWTGNYIYITVGRKEGLGGIAGGFAYGNEAFSKTIPSGRGQRGDFISVNHTIPSVGE